MGKAGKIRVLALGLIQDGDRAFLGEGYDPTKQETFYRVLGGGVEFGETSREALQREFYEEIQAELTNIRYLDCIESIFTFNNEPRHEIIQLYRCDFADRQFYQRDRIPFNEGKRNKVALWMDLNRLRAGEFRLVPEGFLKYFD